MTSLGGLPTYLDLAYVAGLFKSIERHVKSRSVGQRWTDSEVVVSLILLNLVGGDCVEDLNRLEEDEGFCRILQRAQKHGLSRPQRRQLKVGENRGSETQKFLFVSFNINMLVAIPTNLASGGDSLGS